MSDERIDQTLEEPLQPMLQAVPRRSNGLAWLATLLALLAVSLSGFLLYMSVFGPPPGFPMLNAASELESDVARRLAEVADLSKAESARLSGTQREFAEAIRSEVERIDAQLETVADRAFAEQKQSPPTPQLWQLAEVRYLMRIANQRHLMDQDPASAVVLLTAADDILREIKAADNYQVFDVRAQLAKELLALENADTVDLTGLHAQLGALKESLPNALPKSPGQSRDRTPPEPADAGDGRGAWYSLERFLRISDSSQVSSAAMLKVGNAEVLQIVQLRILLALEQAQLAAMRQQQITFEDSLKTADALVKRWMDKDDATVAAFSSKLNELSQLQVMAATVDISGSLRMMDELERLAP